MLPNAHFLDQGLSFILPWFGFSNGSFAYRTFWVRYYITPMIQTYTFGRCAALLDIDPKIFRTCVKEDLGLQETDQVSKSVDGYAISLATSWRRWRANTRLRCPMSTRCRMMKRTRLKACTNF